MIFKRSIQKIVYILIIILVLMMSKLLYKYYIYHNVWADYNVIFGGEEMDDITRSKLVSCWKTSSYDNYFDYSLLSMKRSKSETIVFVGLCQDNGERMLHMWKPIIEKWGGYFKDYQIVVVENDSVDDTREIFLKEAEINKKFVVLCDANKSENTKICKMGLRSMKKGGNKEKNLEERIRILAKFRQVYWEHVMRKYSNYDYMCVIDWDLEGKISTSGFFHGLYYVKNYSDVIACNSFHQSQSGEYLIHDTYPMLNHYRCDYLKENKTLEDTRIEYQMRKKLFYGSPYPVPVESAFGGIALYNIQNVKNKNAFYTNPICPIECEHTTFHKNLRVYIDPWMTFYITKNNH